MSTAQRLQDTPQDLAGQAGLEVLEGLEVRLQAGAAAPLRLGSGLLLACVCRPPRVRELRALCALVAVGQMDTTVACEDVKTNRF